MELFVRALESCCWDGGWGQRVEKLGGMRPLVVDNGRAGKEQRSVILLSLNVCSNLLCASLRTNL